MWGVGGAMTCCMVFWLSMDSLFVEYTDKNIIVKDEVDVPGQTPIGIDRIARDGYN